MFITNRIFASKDQIFKKACELAKIRPTKRQASKFRMGKGIAVKFFKAAQTQLNTESRP